MIMTGKQTLVTNNLIIHLSLREKQILMAKVKLNKAVEKESYQVSFQNQGQEGSRNAGAVT